MGAGEVSGRGRGTATPAVWRTGNLEILEEQMSILKRDTVNGLAISAAGREDGRRRHTISALTYHRLLSCCHARYPVRGLICRRPRLPATGPVEHDEGEGENLWDLA